MLRHTAALLLVTGFLPLVAPVTAQDIPASEPFIPELDVPMSMLDNPQAPTPVAENTTTVSKTDIMADAAIAETAANDAPAATANVSATTGATAATNVSESLSLATTVFSAKLSGTTISTHVVSATDLTTPTASPEPHAQHAAAPEEKCPSHLPELKGENTASTRTYFKAQNEMHKAMDLTYTGDADIDFLRGMIAHHVGAVDMAKTVLEYGKDNQVRRLAREIVRAQTLEINMMTKKLEQLLKRGPQISSEMPRSGTWTDENWVGSDYLAR